ncbi:cytospin-A-like isoform X2 [Gadus macrocephalus]|uniref:cytospin-A-like isoform X2 n=1 Tax=Gadus macrocephalus TaxID=80720 RepID=UPI0028CB15EC|nr:cytospin-A-like isoform X2 [Gadus macrocephalus]
MSEIAFIVEIHMDHYFSSLSTSQTEEPASTDYLDPIPTTMGNHAGKDSIGHTGSPLDFFHTPPTSPSEEAQLAALASSSSSVFTNKMQTPCHPCSPCPPTPTPSNCPRQQVLQGEWALISMESQPSPQMSLSHEKKEEEEAGAKHCGNVGSLSPAPMPLPWGSPTEQVWQERDSGLESPLGAEQVGQETSLVMRSLMEYYRASLGLSPGPDDSVGAVELLRRLVSERGELVEEVNGLKETLRTERAEWLQFQRDLQVAVSVADRLRAEAEQALDALREHHGAAEARLVQALRRQQEQDRELRDLEAQHRDARHQLSTLNAERRRGHTGSDARISARGLAKDGAEPEVNVVGDSSEEEQGNDGKEEGRRQNCALVAVGKKDLEEKLLEGVHTDVEAQDVEGHCEAQPKGVEDGGGHGCVGSLGGEGDLESEKTQLAGKGVAEAYILSLAAIKKKKEAEAGIGTPDHRRVLMLSERSWSLSRLPLPENTNKSSPCQNNSSTLPLCKKEEPAKEKKMTRLLQRQDKKPDEDPNPDSNRPQDAFSVLLRRHGGSRRNALLRWCQTRTKGYKNIEITNFSSSWEDGLAFCAVYHTYMPSHVPYGSLTPEDKKGNLDLAFQTGNSIGITATLTVEEMLKADGPNWQRVLGYIEGIFRHFEM